MKNPFPMIKCFFKDISVLGIIKTNKLMKKKDYPRPVLMMGT